MPKCRLRTRCTCPHLPRKRTRWLVGRGLLVFSPHASSDVIGSDEGPDPLKTFPKFVFRHVHAGGQRDEIRDIVDVIGNLSAKLAPEGRDEAAKSDGVIDVMHRLIPIGDGTGGFIGYVCVFPIPGNTF